MKRQILNIEYSRIERQTKRSQEFSLHDRTSFQGTEEKINDLQG